MFILAKLKMYFVAAGAVIVALGVAYFRGRSNEAAAERERELNEYVETRKRMVFNVADVAISTGVGMLIVFNKKTFPK